MISKDSLKSMPHPSFRKIATHLCLGVAATSLLSGCMIAQGYSEKEQSIVSAMDGGQYQPASRTSRDNIETQSLLAQATFWSREYQLNPADLESAIKLASAVRRMGNPGQAVQIAQTSRALHPRDPYLTAEYAAALIASEQGEKAIKPLQDGLRLAPQYARLWSLMGAALDQGEKYAEARRYYERALSITPKDPNILANLGLSYALEGNAAEAEVWLRRAAALPGAGKGVEQNLALVMQLQGKTAPITQDASRRAPQTRPAAASGMGSYAAPPRKTVPQYGAPTGYRNDFSTTQPSQMSRSQPQQPSQRTMSTAPQQSPYNSSLAGSSRPSPQSNSMTASDYARAAARQSQGRKTVVPAGVPVQGRSVLDNIATNVGPKTAYGVPANQSQSFGQGQMAPQGQPAFAPPTQLRGYRQSPSPQNYGQGYGQAPIATGQAAQGYPTTPQRRAPARRR